VIFTAATAGILISSLAAERLAKRHPQRSLIIAGFVVTLAGIVILLVMVRFSSNSNAAAGTASHRRGPGRPSRPSIYTFDTSRSPVSRMGRAAAINNRRAARRSPDEGDPDEVGGDLVKAVLILIHTS
jgi:hypothetical protein